MHFFAESVGISYDVARKMSGNRKQSGLETPPTREKKRLIPKILHTGSEL